MSGLVADHVLRTHVFPLFVLTALFIALYVVYKIVGDPVLQLVKVADLSTIAAWTLELWIFLGGVDRLFTNPRL